LQLSSCTQLKKLLAELVIIIHFVRFLEIALFSISSISWEALVVRVTGPGPSLEVSGSEEGRLSGGL
jgi:hypothetical protein